MTLSMINGVQAVTARIAQLEQLFVATTDAASAAPTTSSATTASDFASVLAAAMGTEDTALGLGTTGTAAGGGATSLTSLLANPDALASLLGGTGTTTGGSSGAGTSAIGAIGAGGRTPATKLAPGQYPRLTPPAELVGYGNGRIPAERLESIGVGSHRLYSPAARAYRQMTADAAAQGVTIGITDSYRSYDSQVELAGRKGLYSQGGLAATPGTSNHGWGLAVDLDLDANAQQWMRDHAASYGFVEDTPREPWHWAYRPAT
jgi:zinc D-Ala-D-Ala carboxypeptidase